MLFFEPEIKISEYGDQPYKRKIETVENHSIPKALSINIGILFQIFR